MLDRAPDTRERAVLVHLAMHAEDEREELEEFAELARSAGANVVAVVTGSRTQPEAKYFIGTGKAAELRQVIAAESADIALFNHRLSPAQERNLERFLSCRVLDRTGLILDIFAQRARTFEGKLQVELAQLQHLSTRLVRGWTHLERQKGGIGLRGPGETQLETDRRLIRDRIVNLSARLEKVQKQRRQGRQARQKAEIPTVSLVGYTNAGKSTLFNQLTGAEVYAANQLFATLDPTLRRLLLPEAGMVIVADTVGFIRHLPHDLVQAFRATLEETASADLLLHVIDCSDALRDEKSEQVHQVLRDIGADEIPCLEVYNKVDARPNMQPHIDYTAEGEPQRVWLSALTGNGIALLQQAIATRLLGEFITTTIQLPITAGKLRAAFYEQDSVTAETLADDGYYVLSIRIRERVLNHILRQANVTLAELLPPTTSM